VLSAPDSIGFTAVVTDVTGDADEREFTFFIGPAGSYLPGDANGSGDVNGLDVVFMVNFFKGGPEPPFQMDCPAHGALYAACDINGNCEVNGVDVIYMVHFLKGDGQANYCPDCPPSRDALNQLPAKISLPSQGQGN
jgi:hypothetical protein